MLGKDGCVSVRAAGLYPLSVTLQSPTAPIQSVPTEPRTPASETARHRLSSFSAQQCLLKGYIRPFLAGPTDRSSLDVCENW